MTRTRLNASAGFYRPSFFKMYVDRNVDLSDINNFDELTSAIYLHEYIHYLQDLTTTSGYINISTVVDYLKYGNDLIINDGVSNFKVPLIINPLPTNDLFYNIELRKKYVGSSNDNYIVKLINAQIIKQSLVLKSKTIDIDVVEIEFLDTKNKKQKYNFGSHAIIESMAFFIENAIYPGIISAPPHLPYTSAEKLVGFIYPDLLQNRLNLLALCDASLLMFNPGEFFYKNLQKMLAQSYYPSTPEDIYKFCFFNMNFNYNGATTLKQLFTNLNDVTSSQLQDYFTTNIFKDNFKWIDQTFSKALEFRIQNPSFFIDIARGGIIQTNGIFQRIFLMLGTPMVTNFLGEGTFYSPLQNKLDIHPEYLWAISQVYSLYVKPISTKNKICELKTWCRHSCQSNNLNDYTDDNCYNSPWKRVSYPALCPFAVIWKTWGLENEIPE